MENLNSENDLDAICRMSSLRITFSLPQQHIKSSHPKKKITFPSPGKLSTNMFFTRISFHDFELNFQFLNSHYSAWHVVATFFLQHFTSFTSFSSTVMASTFMNCFYKTYFLHYSQRFHTIQWYFSHVSCRLHNQNYFHPPKMCALQLWPSTSLSDRERESWKIQQQQ